MLDYISLGSTPYEEKCEQANVSGSNYQRMRAEIRAFIGQLRRQFGQEPDGAQFAAKFFRDGDYGYYEAVCHFDSKNKTALDFAFKVEQDLPAKWDKKALEELAGTEVGVQA